jgi:23S rRNA (guanosine2251-2'-O)-methyltransferase
MDDVSTLSIMVPDGAPHQGVVMEVRPLRGQHLEDLAPENDSKNIILMLDQVTDPHNVGACMRTAAAFGARALITQDRNSPLESGTLARSAAGGLEILPWIRVANLSDTLGKLRDMGYWHVGLDGGSGAVPIGQLSLGENLVIVMGSEGSGLRPLVKKNCDAIAKIPMPGGLESLNVSNAAAIALYELGGISE